MRRDNYSIPYIDCDKYSSHKILEWRFFIILSPFRQTLYGFYSNQNNSTKCDMKRDKKCDSVGFVTGLFPEIPSTTHQYREFIVIQVWMRAVETALERRNPPVFCIHYASESLRQAHSPRVVAIAVRLVGIDQTRLFSLPLMAERDGIELSAIAQHQLRLERLLLEEFQCFVERMQTKYPTAWWFHWAMRDATFGWPLLQHRCEMHGLLNLSLDESCLIDMHASLVKEFGRRFASKPQLLSLAEMNDLSLAEVMTGDAELEALQRGDFPAVSRSTAKKAELIAQLLERYAEGRLVTGKRRIRKRQRWCSLLPGLPQRELLNVHEASRLCGVSRATWYRMMAGCKVPEPQRFGKRVLWDAKELRQWIDAKCPVLRDWRVVRGQG